MKKNIGIKLKVGWHFPVVQHNYLRILNVLFHVGIWHCPIESYSSLSPVTMKCNNVFFINVMANAIEKYLLNLALIKKYKDPSE
jgi:hypothetical protein